MERTTVKLSLPSTHAMVVDEENQEIEDMESSVRAVENILKYSFENKKLLEDALTHPSFTTSASYQRLEFVGDAVIGLAISNYVFLQYPDADPGKLSLVRSANISTERLSRVAVRHQLYKYVRHNVSWLDEKVKEFVMAVSQEDEAEIHGGLFKAPKVLADIVESVAAAIYVDCKFDLKAMWTIFRDLMEPMIMLEALEQQPQPVTMLFNRCQKDGKHVNIRHWRKEDRNIASVYVDGTFVISASSDQKETAKLHAAKAALEKLFSVETDNFMNADQINLLKSDKQKLHELCGKKKWSAPIYKIQSEVGRSHEKIYQCSVEIEISEGVLFVKGDEKPRLKEAENSAASEMLHGLKDSKYI